MKMTRVKMAGGLACAGLLVALGVYAVQSDPSRPARVSSLGAASPEPARDVGKTPERVSRPERDTIQVPASIAEKMGLRAAAVGAVNAPVSLPDFQAVLALDNDRLSRVHARFNGEVVELGQSADGSDPTPRVGQRVRKGDLLAVIWSTELGTKKSALVDALAKLRAEEQLRDRLKKLFEEGAGAGRSYRDAEKDVQARRVEIAGIERTLRTWRVTEEEIAGVRAEAERFSSDPATDIEAKDWARVEVRAPMSGVILEKNVVVGDIVSTEADLFKIGDLSRLVVWAHVYEEDLPLLEKLPRPIPWTLSLPSQPGMVYSGTLDKIGAVIDPTQHTALVTGWVENPSGELRVGQFVTVTVELPPSENELELPAKAVVEDGRESVVFIQPDPDKPAFIRRPVSLVRRLRDAAYIHSDGGVRRGDHVVIAGALMLQNAMSQLPAPAEPSPEAMASLHGGPSHVDGAPR